MNSVHDLQFDTIAKYNKRKMNMKERKPSKGSRKGSVSKKPDFNTIDPNDNSKRTSMLKSKKNSVSSHKKRPTEKQIQTIATQTMEEDYSRSYNREVLH